MSQRIREFLKAIAHTVRFKITILLFFVFILGGFFIFYNYHLTVDTVYEQASSTHADTVKLYTSQIDDKLKSVNTYFESTMASNDDLVLLENAYTEKEYILTKIRLIKSLQNGINMFSYADFIYVNETRRNDFFRICQNTNIYESTKNLTPAFIALQKEHLLDKQSAYQWHLVDLNGSYYFIKAFTTDTLEVGICIKFDNFLPSLSQLGLKEDSSFLFLNGEGKILEKVSEPNVALPEIGIPNMERITVSNSSTTAITISCPSSTGIFCSQVIIPRKVVLSNLPWLLRYGQYLVIVVLLLLPVITLIILQRYIYTPLNSVVLAMRTVAEGDMKIRITKCSSSSEFALVNQSFNNMLDQITSLKLNAYKEEIYRHKAELKQLKLQLNPHFLLNSLNMVYTLVKTKHLDIAQEFTMCLIKHFRYILRKDETFVLLSDELDFIRNYLRLHQLHYPNSLNFTLRIPEYLNSKLIPQLMIENFVENTIKYASHSTVMDIVLDISMKLHAEEPYMHCTITDNGEGFTEELLERFNSLDYRQIRTNNIGIYNIKRRLDLIYGGAASIHFSNIEPHGAKIEFALPLDDKYIQTAEVE